GHPWSVPQSELGSFRGYRHRLRSRYDGMLPARSQDRRIEGMDMPAIRGYVAAVVAALLALGFFTSYASAQGTNRTDVIIQLRLAGDVEALPPIRSCLADNLSQMPDVTVATVPTDGVLFIGNCSPPLSGRSDNVCHAN